MSIYSGIYSFLNRYRRYVPVLIDTLVAFFSYALPYALVISIPAKIFIIRDTILIYAITYVGTFMMLKVYRNMWRYTGVVDLYHCLVASAIANLLFFTFTKAFRINVLYIVYPLTTALSALLSITARVVFRAFLIIGKTGNKEHKREDTSNVMIVGAGQATLIMLNEINGNSYSDYEIKCIVDDDISKVGRKFQSIPVVGDTDSIAENTEKYSIDKIIIAIPSLDKENKKRILNLCAQTKCKLKILPAIYSLIENKDVNDLMSKLRDVQVEDLLGREPIVMDCQLTKEYIKNKTVLVTGGGGSIGSELCRQIATYFPKKLIILDIYENNIYVIQQELIRKYGDSLNLEVEIASIRDKVKLEQVFSTQHIDIVFHAAAHKHVPLMEKNPEEAVKNNIIGTYNTVCMADKYKIKKFVLISTDKAVNPTNIMGATKRICEMIIQAFDHHSDTDFVAVRFGNVLGSNGSVIPLFMDQIRSGGPVTVTDERITRYFMTIPEAVQLVLRASVIAKGGEVFVLDMGEPVRIKDLAYNLIRLAGLVPEKDIKIVYTGLRPGEKLYEELLITSDSNQTETELDKIFIEESTKINEEDLLEAIYQLQIAAVNMDKEKELKLIEHLVPTYKRTPNNKIQTEDKELSIHKRDNERVYSALRTETA